MTSSGVRRTYGWQDKKSVMECNRYMLDNQIATDVCFQVGSSGESATVRAHKYVLISRSAVFEAMFTGGMVESRSDCDIINVPDIELDTFQNMLRFVYYNEADITVDNALPLMYAGNKYLLGELVQKCGHVLETGLTTDNVCAVLEILEQNIVFETDQLRARCFSYVSSHLSDVVKTDAFFKLSRGTLNEIVKLDVLQIAKEGNLLKSCVEWAERQLLKSSQIDRPTDHKIRSTLGDVLFKIRFPTMDQAEFTDIVRKSTLLTAEEKNTVFFYIATKEFDENLRFDCGRRIYLLSTDNRFIRASLPLGGGGGGQYAVNFQTSADTTLTAVGLYGSSDHSATHDVTLDIWENGSSASLTPVTRTKMASNGTDAPVRVPFDQHVAIEANRTYTLSATLVRGPKTFHGENCSSVPLPILCGKFTVTFCDDVKDRRISKYYIKGQFPLLFFQS